MRSVIVLAFVVAGLSVAQAQTAPDSENGRYSFSPVSEGLLRLDTRTGQVSLCAKQASGHACNTVPDERAALENEIARLQRENGALKKDMLARNLPLPGGVTSGTPQASERNLQLNVPMPSDAEIDRVMTTLREDVAPPRRDGSEDAARRQESRDTARRMSPCGRWPRRAADRHAQEAVARARIEREFGDVSAREPARRHEE